MRIIVTPYRQYLNLDGIEYLTIERRARLYKYRHDADRARCLAAGLLMRCYAGVISEPLCGVHEKPGPIDGSYFNVSHSGEYVVAALNDNEIGVDIEPYGDFTDDMARACFSKRERAFIYCDKNINRAFFRLWTAKESVMKLFGDGFYMAPESFEIWPPDARHHTVLGRDVYLFYYEFDAHILCAACFEPYRAPEIIFVNAMQVLHEISENIKTAGS